MSLRSMACWRGAGGGPGGLWPPGRWCCAWRRSWLLAVALVPPSRRRATEGPGHVGAAPSKGSSAGWPPVADLLAGGPTPLCGRRLGNGCASGPASRWNAGLRLHGAPGCSGAALRRASRCPRALSGPYRLDRLRCVGPLLAGSLPGRTIFDTPISPCCSPGRSAFGVPGDRRGGPASALAPRCAPALKTGASGLGPLEGQLQALAALEQTPARRAERRLAPSWEDHHDHHGADPRASIDGRACSRRAALLLSGLSFFNASQPRL